MEAEKIYSFDETEALYEKAVDIFGETTQAYVCVEEMSELTKEILKNFNRGKDNKEEMLEEFVDVLITLRQLQIIMKFDNEKIKETMNKKLHRLEERLKNAQ